MGGPGGLVNFEKLSVWKAKKQSYFGIFDLYALTLLYQKSPKGRLTFVKIAVFAVVSSLPSWPHLLNNQVLEHNV